MWENFEILMMFCTVILQNWIFMLPIFVLTILLEVDAWQWSLRKFYFKK